MRTTTLEPVSSSDARAAILSCHEELRGLVTETIHFVESDCDFEPLRTHARELYEAFEEHIDFEERVLPTALRDVIGWGSVLQAQVVEGHEKQRAILASARSALEPAGLSPARLAQSVRTLANTILGDLKTEESCLLSADLDALATDASGG
ncbi:MAG TPA: hypothetical protein VFG23_23070 [Polyangia bacterium]|nr:hypothetical protein [Polyangia bacterium]